MNIELEATFPGSHLVGNEKFVFNLREAPGSVEVTMIIFDADRACIIIDQSKSSIQNLGSNLPDLGQFIIFPGENLIIRICLDNSIIEVYANDVPAATSRIYPSLGGLI